MDKRYLELIMGVIMIVVLWIFTSKGVMGNVLQGKEIKADNPVEEVCENADRGEEINANSETTGEKTHIVVIDPGHGGIDPGMVGIGGIKEKDINLALSKILSDKLTSAGFEVVMTREEDIGLYDENAGNKKNSDLKKRCNIIETNQAEIVVCIHQNSFSDSNVCGPQVFYYKHSEEGKKLATAVNEAIHNEITDCNERPIKADTSYFMLVHTPCPTVIVECGFITNEEEAALLQTDEYREQLAVAICTGVEKYFEE